MATTPKGNFMAFQPLKPTEYKVGDIYSNMIDGMIKRGDAKKAAELKAAQEKNKYIGERFDKVKIDPFATTSQLTDAAMDMFKQTYEYVADQRMKAENDPSNAMGYLSNAEKAQNSYLSWAKTLGDAKFIENATKKSNEIASGQYFLDSDETDQWDLFNKGQYRPTLENGEWKVAVPKNRYATDEDPLKKLTIGEYINLNTVLPPKDLTKELDKNIKDISAKFADEWSKNTDGNRTIGWKGYAEKRGKEWFDNVYGEYKASFVPTELQQFSKRTLKKQIENEADYNEVKKTLLDQLKAYVPNENTTDTKFTQAQLEGQRLSNQQKKKAIQKMDQATMELSTPQAQNSVIREYDANGNYKGYFNSELATVNIPGTDNFIAAKPVVSKDGKTVYNKYYTGGFSKDGVIVYSPITDPASVIQASKSKDPIKVLANLNSKATTLKPITSDFRPKLIKDDKSSINKNINEADIRLKAKSSTRSYEDEFMNNTFRDIYNESN